MGLSVVALKIVACMATATALQMKERVQKLKETNTGTKHFQSILLLISGAYVGLSLMVLLPESDTMFRKSQEDKQAGNSNGNTEEAVVFPLGYVAATLAFSVLMLIDKIIGYDYHQQSEVLFDCEEIVSLEMVLLPQPSSQMSPQLKRKSCASGKGTLRGSEYQIQAAKVQGENEISNFLCVESGFCMLGFAIGASHSVKLLLLLVVPVFLHMWIHSERISDGYLDSQLVKQEMEGDMNLRGMRRSKKQTAMLCLFSMGAAIGLGSTLIGSLAIHSVLIAVSSGSLLYTATMKLIAENYDVFNYPMVYYAFFILGMTLVTFVFYYQF